MTRFASCVVAAIVILALLVGCGGQSAPAASPAASTSPAAKSSASPSASPQSSPAQPQPSLSAQQKWEQGYKSWEQTTYEAAKKEGKVVIYAPWTQDQQAPFKKAWAQKYPGVSLEYLSMMSPEAIPKLQAEQTASKQIADIFHSGFGGTRQFPPLGLTEVYEAPATKDPSVKWLYDLYMDGDGPTIFMGDGVFFMVNSNLLTPEQEPKSWKELEDPKWNGKILMQDPSTGGTGNTWVASALTTYGEDHARKVIANSAIFKGVSGGAVSDVARGEYAILVPSAGGDSLAFINQGAPLRVVNPTDGMIVTPSQVVLIPHAPHQNAAKLYFNFLFTKEGQQAVSELGSMPMRNDVEMKYKQFTITKTFPGHPFTKEFSRGPFVEARTAAGKIMQALGKK